MDAAATSESPPPTSSDASLCEAAQAGDAKAFEALVVRHQGLVFGLALGGIGDRTAAEDIAQEAFMVAWRELPSLRDPARFRPWLAGIARNRAREARRRSGRRETSDVVDLATEIDDPEQALAAAESEQLVWSELSRMPSLYREPLVLYYQEELDTRAVAEALGIAEAAARKRLSRGREQLRDRVEKTLAGALRKHRPGIGFTAAVAAALSTRSASAAKASWLAAAGVAGVAAVIAVGAAVASGGGDESPAGVAAIDAAPVTAVAHAAAPTSAPEPMPAPMPAIDAGAADVDAAPAKSRPARKRAPTPRRARRRATNTPTEKPRREPEAAPPPLRPLDDEELPPRRPFDDEEESPPRRPFDETASPPRRAEVRSARARVSDYTVVASGGIRIKLNKGKNAGIKKGWRGHLVSNLGTPVPNSQFTIVRVTSRQSVGKVALSVEEVEANLTVTLWAP